MSLIRSRDAAAASSASPRRRISWAPTNMYRQKSNEDAEGNPVPVTQAHFGKEPASRFQKTRFFNSMLNYMEKNGNGGVDACFVLRQIQKHRLDRTFSEEDIAIMLLEWLMPKVEHATATDGSIRIGDFKVPARNFYYYIDPMLKCISEIVLNGSEAVAGGAATCAPQVPSRLSAPKLTRIEM